MTTVILYCSQGHPSHTKRGFCLGCSVVNFLNGLAGFYEQMRNRRIKKKMVKKMSSARRRRMKLRATSDPTGYAEKEPMVYTRRSTCCDAPLRIVGRTTLYYVCCDCESPADAVNVQ